MHAMDMTLNCGLQEAAEADNCLETCGLSNTSTAFCVLHTQTTGYPHNL